MSTKKEKPAEYEWPSFVADIEAFRDQVVQRKQEGLMLEFRLIESERHSGTTDAEPTPGAMPPSCPG